MGAADRTTAAVVADRRAIDPERFAHLRRELGANTSVANDCLAGRSHVRAGVALALAYDDVLRQAESGPETDFRVPLEHDGEWVGTVAWQAESRTSEPVLALAVRTYLTSRRAPVSAAA
jgi:hypothetical protein